MMINYRRDDMEFLTAHLNGYLAGGMFAAGMFCGAALMKDNWRGVTFWAIAAAVIAAGIN